ncbi:MAG TPA: amidohydrolase family protein [Steroidobacteraceae bacterium]|nr:amidohydrolase family protein [Steroidobacteraceae bacterium]
MSVHGDRIIGISNANVANASDTTLAAAQIIDGRGLYLVSGLIDSHVHLGYIPGMTAEQELKHPEIARAARAQIPRSYLYFGFTTLIDLVSTPGEMARWNNHAIVPDSYFCGAAGLIDGYPMNFLPKSSRYKDMPYFLVEPGAGLGVPPADAAAHSPEAVVARMKADGAICVKTFFERGFGAQRDLPVPKLETIRALVRAAHAAGLPVLLHANTAEAQTFGLDAGVDIIAHGLWHWNEPSAATELTPAVKAILDRVVDAKVGWQPTIQVLVGERDLFSSSFLSDPILARVLPPSLIDWYGTQEGQWFHDFLVPLMRPPANADATALDATVVAEYAVPIGRVERATGYLAKHRARLLFGTDTPSGPIYANPPGLNGWLEMQRLTGAGVTPTQIFQAATLSNAQALGLDKDIGTVQVGRRANLLLLRDDPTQTIQAYANIAKVILRGRVIDPSELVATRFSP